VASTTDGDRPPDGESRLTGVGVVLVRGVDLLFGLRRGIHGGGTWSVPGGHLDAGESADACALRELYEEAGLGAVNPQVVAQTDDDFPEGLRNVTTRGVRLNDLLGRRFWVGEVLCEGTRLCEPCQYLADLTGKPLLGPLVHRGGLRADIVRGGFIRRGDLLQIAAEGRA
jgi:8-oxo-dGTP pyrophosphatase MutT (NUDIX family)